MDAGPDLVAHLRRLEEDLLRPEVRRSRTELEAPLARDFAEIGLSGRAYDRESIIAALATEGAGDVGIEDFAVRLLAPGIALATYRSAAGPGGPFGARRSSVWRLDVDGAWRLTFHQGTPASRGARPDRLPARRAPRSVRGGPVGPGAASYRGGVDADPSQRDGVADHGSPGR